MKSLILAALAACLAVPAGAQVCLERSVAIADLREKYGESRRMVGLTAGGSVMIEVFVNEETGSWTIASLNPRDGYCLLIAGRDAALLDAEPQGEDM